MRRKHYSDADLMAHLDGELPFVHQQLVGWHLRSCWQCRARSTALNSQAEALAAAYQKTVLPDPCRKIEAAQAFRQWVETVERRKPAAIPGGCSRWRAAFALSLLLALGAGLSGYWSYTLARVERAPAPSVPVWTKMKPGRSGAPELRSAPMPRAGLALPANGPRPVAAPHPARLEGVNLNDAEVEVCYVLHRRGACGSYGIEVIRKGDRLVVQGVVPDEERKRDLLTAIAGTGLAGTVRPDIKTAAEVVDGARNAGASEASPVLVGRAPSRLRAEIEIQEYVAKHPEQRGERLTGPAEMTSIANDAIGSAGALLDDAWELRRLAAHYGDGEAELSPSSRELLTLIMRDHAGSMRRNLAALAARLAPLLSRTGEVLPRAAAIGPDAADWRRSCEGLFEAARRLNTIVGKLFAGGVIISENGTRVSPESGDDVPATMHDLALAFSAVNGNAAALREPSLLGARRNP